MTGFGQDGPLAQAAGHDINYISIGGALGSIGREGQPPTPPLNLVGDFGGGGMLLVVGVLGALLHARATRRGPGRRRGDGRRHGAADGPAVHRLAGCSWPGRGPRLPRLGRPLLRRLRDGRRRLRVGRRHRAAVLRRSAGAHGTRSGEPPAQMDARRLAARRSRSLAEVFRTKTRDEWCALLEGTDACVTPVLDPPEVEHHPHNVAREVFVEVDGVLQAGAGAAVRPHAGAGRGVGPAGGRRPHRRGPRRLRSADELAALRLSPRHRRNGPGRPCGSR